MTRILIVETASPKRICQKAEQILEAGIYPDPEIVILCEQSTREAYRGLPGVKICSMESGENHRIPKELHRKKFDAVFAFWTGENKYRWMKLLSLRMRAGKTYITAGDGNEFRLTWKAVCRHAVFRMKHPLPTDHYDFAIPPEPEDKAIPEEKLQERVLIIQSAEPIFVIKALQKLKEKSVFCNPSYSLFCRNRPDAVNSFRKHPMLDQILTHSESRKSWMHLRNLRKQKFDAIVLFMTGDPSYRKIKIFAFLLGVPSRRILIFNERNDCFFFNWKQWFERIARRIHGRHKNPLPLPIEKSEQILIIQSAEPIFVIKALQKLKEKSVFRDPSYSLFCRNRPEVVNSFRKHPMLDQILTHSESRESWKHLRNLRKQKFDAIVLFITGDPSYRKIKIFAFLLGVPRRRILIFNETNDCFFFNWKQWFGLASRQRQDHPKIPILLPMDQPKIPVPLPIDRHKIPIPLPEEKKERILVIQSAESIFILKALEKLKERAVFRDPSYSLFCRNRPEVVNSFRKHPMLDQILTHTESRKSWKHLRNLRKQKFDAIVLFITGDPSYRKIKIFAFLLGVPRRRILIFNETNDCFFFNWKQWFRLISRRMQDRPNSGIRTKHIRCMRMPISYATKMVLFPFRFLWLLLVWVRLRISGIKSSRKNHDYSLQLPPFPGA